jgi:hypothetical protein
MRLLAVALTAVLIVLSVAAIVGGFALLARRLLGLRFGLVRLLLAGLVGFVVAGPIAQALAGPNRAATAGIMAMRLLGTGGGPAVTATVSLYQLLGYNLLVVCAILVLRVLVLIFRPDR